MRIQEPNTFTRILDLLFVPAMWILNGGQKPLQETHDWHTYRVESDFFENKNGALVNNPDTKARFGESAPMGLYHMPMFGGLRKYAVIEVSEFTKHWHIGWKGDGWGQIHRLPIKDRRIKLLTGTNQYWAFAIDDNGKFLSAKVVGYGKIGDRKFKGLRLF